MNIDSYFAAVEARQTRECAGMRRISAIDAPQLTQAEAASIAEARTERHSLYDVKPQRVSRLCPGCGTIIGYTAAACPRCASRTPITPKAANDRQRAWASGVVA